MPDGYRRSSICLLSEVLLSFLIILPDPVLFDDVDELIGLFLWLIGPLPCVDEVVVIHKLLDSGGNNFCSHMTMKTLLLVAGFYTSILDLYYSNPQNSVPVSNFSSYSYQIISSLCGRPSSGHKDNLAVVPVM